MPLVHAAADRLATYAPIVLLLAFAIAILGATGGLLSLPKSTENWHNWVRAAMGFAVTVLTAVNSFFFVLDHKTLRILAQDAHDSATIIEADIREYKKVISIPVTAEEKENLAKPFLLSIAANQQKLQAMEQRAREGGHTLRVNMQISLVHSLASAAAMPPLSPLLSLQFATVHAAQQSPTQQSPKWVENPASTKYQSSYVGNATCSTPSAAEEWAQYNAMEQLALDLQSKGTGLDMDTLMNFAERNSQRGRSHFTYDRATKLFSYDSLLSFNRLSLSTDALKRERPAKPASQWKSTSAIQPGFNGPLRVTVPQPSISRNGRFEFVLAVNASSTKLDLAIEEILVHQDDSPGSTRWIFRFRANGAPLLAIPMHRYDDSGQPTRCLMRSGEIRRASIPITQPGRISLEIEGLKP